MALTPLEKVRWRTAGRRIDILLLDIVANEPLPAISCNLVLDQHHQTGAQADVRIAGDYDPYKGETVNVPSYGVLAYYYDSSGSIVDVDYTDLSLYVRNKVYDDQTDTTVLRLFSIECYLTDAKFTIDDLYSGTAVTIVDWINSLVQEAVPPGVSTFVDNDAGITGNVLADQQRGLFGTSFLTNIDNILMGKNARLVYRPTGGFSIVSRNKVGEYTLPLEALTDGPDKLMLKLSVEEDRERWYNAVTLRYWWDNGTTSQETIRSARVWLDSGPESPDLVGYKIYTEEISGGSTGTEANRAALNTLESMLRRRNLIKATFVLCPWVNPGDRLIYGGRLWEISKLQFDLTSDTMNFEAEPVTGLPPVENYTPTF